MAEAKVTPKAPEVPAKPKPEIIDGLPGRTVKLLGKEYKLRMLLVSENDDANDAAKGPDGVVNGRLLTRMVLTAMIVGHPGLEDLAKLPQPVLERLIETANEINDADNLDDDPNA